VISFFVVAKDTGAGNEMRTQFRHPTAEVGRKEAERLATVYGARFMVFECIGVAEPANPPIVWTEATPEIETIYG
jgi:hypothetical protein